MLFALMALLGAGVLASLASAAGGTHRTILISRANGAHGAKGNGDDFHAPSTSANGRFVAFQSTATNLSSADSNPDFDIYVRDRVRHRTILVSRASGTHGAKGDSLSGDPSISADGRFVAFDSFASNLSSADSDTHEDVYVRDLRRHRTILVSRRTGTHGAKGDDDSVTPSISADGHSVAFTSDADNLSSADPPSGSGDTDIYVRQLGRHRTILVSRRNGVHGAKAHPGSDSPSISGDGRSVAFKSRATNLSSADPSSDFDVYVRQLGRHRTILASRRNGAHGASADNDISDISISADGRSVAFQTNATNLSGANPGGNDSAYVRQLGRHRTILVSRRNGAHGASANDFAELSGLHSLSATGRFVAFDSGATNLSSAATDGTFQVYVRDLRLRRTVLVSRRNGTHGAKGNDQSFSGSISDNGGTVAFDSQATNLSSADSSGDKDIYVRTGPF